MSTEIENLLKKYFLRTITQEEKVELEEWILLSSDNKKRFDELLLSYKKAIAADYLKSTKRSKRIKIRYAALAITAMMAGVIVTTLTILMRTNTTTTAENNTVLTQQHDTTLNGITISTNGETKTLNAIRLNRSALHGAAITDSCLDYSLTAEANASETKKEENTPISIYVPNGEQFKVILSDGTKLWINSNTKVDYLSCYTESERRIKIDGEVFLEVTPNPKKPFIVETSNSEIKVLGTKFNVCSYSSEANITTTLVEGSVSFNNEKVLRPNEQLQFNKTTKNCTIRNVDASLFASWTDGNYYFNEITIVDLIQLFKRVYNIDIHLKSKKSLDKTFTGSIVKSIEAKEMFETIMKTTKIEYVIDKEEITIW